MLKQANITYSMEVSPEEKAAAERIRKLFAEFLKSQDDYIDFLEVFFDSLDQIENPKHLVRIAPTIKKYEFRLKQTFNVMLGKLGTALKEYSKSFQDTELDSLRDLLIQHVKDLRNNFIELTHEMNDLEDDDFVNKVKEKYDIIRQYNDKIKEIVKNELFGHIDYDILGKIRLSSFIPLIKRRGH